MRPHPRPLSLKGEGRIHEGNTVTTSPPTVLTNIVAILQREFPTLRKTALVADTPLLSAGLLDSFAVVTLIASLEEAFGIDQSPRIRRGLTGIAEGVSVLFQRRHLGEAVVS